MWMYSLTCVGIWIKTYCHVEADANYIRLSCHWAEAQTDELQTLILELK